MELLPMAISVPAFELSGEDHQNRSLGCLRSIANGQAPKPQVYP